ncbi:MAG: type IX secretion system sortase PorU [Muribaculaceae bacterium]|nr:type IX secretion system sortase PorU [Muribaculaceae bacterium]
MKFKVLKDIGSLCASIGVITAALLAPAKAHAYPATCYADSSVLAQGKWVKVQVDGSGIYAITAEDASRWGLGDLSNVRVFGYGGAMINEVLDDKQIDDLPQVPVLRTENKLLFYAQGTVKWTTESNNVQFLQQQNPYSTASYYFITDDSRFSDKSPQKATAQPSDSIAINTITGRLYHEKELANDGMTGRVLLGDDFRSNQSQTFNFKLKDYIDGTEVRVLSNFAAKTMVEGSLLTFKYNGKALETTSADRINPITTINHYHFNTSNSLKTFKLTGTDELNYNITYSTNGALYLARLNYITIAYQRKLALDDGQLMFGLRNVYPTFLYQLSGAASNTHIWDISNIINPVELNINLEGSEAKFSPLKAGTSEFVAFNENAAFPSPTKVGDVSHQNIHGEPMPDMIILSPKEYLAQANRIARLHQETDSMRVLVLDHQLVFNEFSSGAPDAMAYRKLCKMFYDRGASADNHKLGYLLLFGDGSYDNRQLTERIRATAYPMLLTWQSPETGDEYNSFTSDDFFVSLTDSSTQRFYNTPVNLAVGRIPVKSVTEARNAVDKLLKYLADGKPGIWKNNVLNIADDENGAIHMVQADAVIETAKENDGDGNIYNRVYTDAFPNKRTGLGRYYPDARDKMFNTLAEGVAWCNYTGHADHITWTNEGLLTRNDVDEKFFYQHLPIMYAATCEFARFDSYNISGAESLFLNNTGGMIAVICPARLVYIPDNGALNEAVAHYMFKRDENGKAMRIGDMMMKGKNDLKNYKSNPARYILLGDPAMRPVYATEKAVIESINGNRLDPNNPPVFKARQTLTFEGKITDYKGNPLNDFNGQITAALYDCETPVTTHGWGDEGAQYSYNDRTNRLGFITSSVTNGSFSFKITVPSEIVANYDNFTPSLINVYATDGKRDAQGYNENFYIYGYDDTVKPDEDGPVIEYLGLNSENFVDGSDVDSSPLVIAKVSDEQGLNFSAAGIGHNMTLTLDEINTFSDLASHFTPLATDNGASGTINYKLNNLAPGQHTLKLKVWDVFNNSSESTITFNVVEGLKPTLYDVYCDANPASVETHFYVRHDRPDANIVVYLQIFDLMGREVWSVRQAGRSDLFTTFPITWDLTDKSGRRVDRGIYVYRATITTDGNKEASKAKKIAVTAR